MTYCEDCRHYEQHYFEDRARCREKKKATEATNPACEKFEPMDGQTKLEV